MIDKLAIAGFRSIRSCTLQLGPLTVVTGANGSGKSNVYRALRLLSHAADGALVQRLSEQGGIDGVRWAGRSERGSRVALRLGYSCDAFGYAVDLGLPVADQRSLFWLDAEIKQEHIFSGSEPRPAGTVLERKGPSVRIREGRGWATVPGQLASWASVLDQLPGSDAAPEITQVRQAMRAWRFYDSWRTDAGAPARALRVASRAARLDDDGGNLASVLQTTIEAGAGAAIAAAVADAFAGCSLLIRPTEAGLSLALEQPGMARPLAASELSDGTLQYLLLVAVLTSVQPPELMVLNEPERSLHGDLIPALANAIRAASTRTQVLVVTHSAPLADSLGGARVRLRNDAGETVVEGREGPLDQPSWQWPKR